MNKSKFVCIIGLTVLILASFPSCSSEGAGSFPNFYTAVQDSAPSIASSSLQMHPEEYWIDSMFSTATPDTSASDTDWSTVAATTANLYGQVLVDSGLTGPVKSIYVVLAQAQSNLSTINSTYSDSDGGVKDCTAIPSTTNVTTPFFATATNAAFNNFDDAGKYTCYVSTAGTPGNIQVFGRQAIASPSAGCTDAYEYYFLYASSADDQENTEQVETRGVTKDFASVQRFYYNGCSKDFKLFYNQTTAYVAGVEFSSRTELNGNVTDHTFSMRVAYIDMTTSTNGNFYSFIGEGKAKKTAATDADTYFWVGHKEHTCSASETCAAATGFGNYCLKNEGVSNTYSVASAASDCSDYATAYNAYTLLLNTDLSHAYFDTSTTALGL